MRPGPSSGRPGHLLPRGEGKIARPSLASGESHALPHDPLDGEDGEEEEQGARLVPERGLLGPDGLAGPGAEQGGELLGLVVGEDAAAGGAGEAVEGVAGGGELDALGGLARGDFEGGLGGRTGGGGARWRTSASCGTSSRIRYEPRGRGGAVPSKRRGWPATGRSGTTATASPRGASAADDAGGDEQVGGDAGEARGDPGLEPGPFPLGDLGTDRAEPDERVARRQLARRRPAHHLAPEPVVVGVADPMPPAPGAVGPDPEHLAEPVGLRGDDRERGRPGPSPGRSPPAWPGRRGPRGAAGGPSQTPRLGSGSAASWSIGQASASARADREGVTATPGARLGCAGSAASGSTATGLGSSTGRSLRTVASPACGEGQNRGPGLTISVPPARRRTIRAAPRPRRAGPPGRRRR